MTEKLGGFEDIQSDRPFLQSDSRRIYASTIMESQTTMTMSKIRRGPLQKQVNPALTPSLRRVLTSRRTAPLLQGSTTLQSRRLLHRELLESSLLPILATLPLRRLPSVLPSDLLAPIHQLEMLLYLPPISIYFGRRLPSPLDSPHLLHLSPLPQNLPQLQQQLPQLALPLRNVQTLSSRSMVDPRNLLQSRTRSYLRVS